MQDCPYKNSQLKRLPCDYCQHPTREHIFLCKTCTNWYDVREIGGNSADSFWLTVGGLILLFVLVSNGFFPPKNVNYTPDRPTLNEIQD